MFCQGGLIQACGNYLSRYLQTGSGQSRSLLRALVLNGYAHDWSSSKELRVECAHGIDSCSNDEKLEVGRE
jgi:hypothetical protein